MKDYNALACLKPFTYYVLACAPIIQQLKCRL